MSHWLSASSWNGQDLNISCECWDICIFPFYFLIIKRWVGSASATTTIRGHLLDITDAGSSTSMQQTSLWRFSVIQVKVSSGVVHWYIHVNHVGVHALIWSPPTPEEKLLLEMGIQPNHTSPGLSRVGNLFPIKGHFRFYNILGEPH